MSRSHFRRTAFFLALALSATMSAQTKPRARDLGVPFDGTPGPNNAITDVKGVEVGHTTLISGEGKLEIGKGPVRTGVTAIHPRGKASNDAVFAAWFTLNGNGEMTGTTWVDDSGFLNGPVMITNTHSVGVVRDAVIAWKVKHGSPDMEGYWWSLPVVAETWDGYLNDINGFHVKPEDAWHALDAAHTGPVEEGNVGGGTGMICNEFKGGIGTSSRVLDAKGGRLHRRGPRAMQLRIARTTSHRGHQRRPRNSRAHRLAEGRRLHHRRGRHRRSAHSHATQAYRQEESLSAWAATAATLATARATSSLPSPRPIPAPSVPQGLHQLTMLPNDSLDPIFLATVQSTEEAVVNAMVAAETMTGINNHTVIALPHDRLREALKKYNRLTK